MAQFGSATFRERGESATYFPTWSSTAQSTILRPIGGSRVVIQTSGQIEHTLDLPIRCTAAELQALRSRVDSMAMLQFSGGTRQAYLRAIGEAREIGQHGLYFATLSLTGL